MSEERSEEPVGGVLESELPPAVGDTPWKRPALRRLVILPITNVTDWLFPLLPLVIFAWTSGGVMLWLLLAAPFVLLARGAASIFFTRYRIHAGQFLVKRGVLNKEVATIPLERIRTVDVEASLPSQLLGIADLSVRTGGATATELKGVVAAHARELRMTLLSSRLAAAGMSGSQAGGRRAPHDAQSGGATAAGVFPAPDEPERTLLCRLDPTWVLLAPFSLSGFGALAAAYYFGSKLMEEKRLAELLSPWLESAREGTLRIDPVALWVGGGLLLLVLAVVLSMVLYVFAHWNYQLTRDGDGGLHVTRGLTTSRATVIEESRMRGVVLERPLFLSIARGGQAKALVTGGMTSGQEVADAVSGAVMLVPPAPLSVSRRVLAEVLDDPRPLEVTAVGHGPAARRRRWFRALSLPVVVAPVLAVGCWRWGWPVWLFAIVGALVVVQSWLAWLRNRRLGHALVPGYLVSDQGTAPFSRSVVRVRSIIGWQVTETWFQRRRGLVTLSALVASGLGAVQVIDVPKEEAVRLIREATPGMADAYLVMAEESSPALSS
ncbi:PH domain-containing protein [Austwickia chelonae]|uniref:PH domain-containing protein n=1 Tax=Austwickia chelonae TaxID=100225 RepID=UPI000E237C40|nr:PH domain-containing protein [Austwickia chelonae]